MGSRGSCSSAPVIIRTAGLFDIRGKSGVLSGILAIPAGIFGFAAQPERITLGTAVADDASHHRDNAVFGPSLTAFPHPGTLSDRPHQTWPDQVFFHRQAPPPTPQPPCFPCSG